MCDRHEKWVRVVPGTVIPAGQPYRIERPRDCILKASEYESATRTEVPGSEFDYFVDSSWKSPLVLPTTPTWGIAVGKRNYIELGRWSLGRDHFRSEVPFHWIVTPDVLDFIPLTDEQVARIEAAQ